MTETTDTPEMVKVKATEVKPYHYGVWCSIEGREPFTNPICVTKWSEDGKRVRFMLETHNFDSAEPDEILDLVPLNPDAWHAQKYSHWTIGPPPKANEPFRAINDLLLEAPSDVKNNMRVRATVEALQKAEAEVERLTKLWRELRWCPELFQGHANLNARVIRSAQEALGVLQEESKHD